MFFHNFPIRFFAPENEQGASAPAAPMTMDEIAASLVVEAPKEPEPKAATRKQEPADPVTEASSDDATGATDEDDAGDADAGGDQNVGGDADGEDFDPFSDENLTRSDEQEPEGPDAELHEVIVDGKKVEVTLAELKRRFSGEAAIERRLQAANTKLTEATELRAGLEQEVTAERSRLTAERNRLATALQALRGTIAAPMVKRPDPAMARTDPNKYNAQLAAFNADQIRVTEMNAKVDAALETNAQQNTAERQEIMAIEADKFIRAVPAMQNPANAPKVMQLIHNTATKHGFTPQEVAGNTDHRLLVLALKAGRYDALMAQRKGVTPPAKSQTAVKPGGGDAAGAMGATGRSRAAAYARSVQKAKETGSIDDVAATLIAGPNRRRR